jgi:predicted ATPase
MELARLCDALDAALAGRPGVLLCQGEPGIGKTRLAEELSSRARRRGALVAWGSGVESAGAPPFWPWVQVLRALADRVDLTALAAGSGLTNDLAVLAPDVFGTAPPPVVNGDGEGRFRQFDAVARLLRDVSREWPVLIVLDDAHWADRPSVLLIRHLARTLAGERVLLVVTARSTETEHAMDFAELLREPVTQQVELTGLPPSAVREQLAALTGQRIDVAEAGQVHALTGGNPFFVIEVGRVLPACRVGGGVVPITANVRDTIAARLGRMTPAACGCSGRPRSSAGTSR